MKEKGENDFIIIEASSCIGGRIHTIGQIDNCPIEMGATWFNRSHTNLIKLLEKLAIETFPQKMGDKVIYEPSSSSDPYFATMPPNDYPSLRIKGGTSTLIDTLAQEIGINKIHTSEKVTSIRKTKEGVEVITDKNHYLADKVITTLPPNLLINSIDFSPALPQDLIDIATRTHTWMGESIKVALTFKSPFWTTVNSTATIFSNVGPITEMYEHNNYEGSFFALKGFINPDLYTFSKQEREKLLLDQLRKYYGPIVDKEFLSYHEKIWRKEKLTFQPYSSMVYAHQNNGHQFYQKSFWDNRLMISGSETSLVHPGYMEGAVWSGRNI